MHVRIEGFAFNDYCYRCGKIQEHRIAVEAKHIIGVCSACGESRELRNLSQVHYPKTDLWVTRFNIDDSTGAVAGKLVDALRHVKSN